MTSNSCTRITEFLHETPVRIWITWYGYYGLKRKLLWPIGSDC